MPLGQKKTSTSGLGKHYTRENPRSKTITIRMYKGVLDDVIGIPKGWIWELVDWDLIKVGEKKKPTKEPEERVMRVEVDGGIVSDVKNVPKGYFIDVQEVGSSSRRSPRESSPKNESSRYKLVRVDNWSRGIYKDIQTGKYYVEVEGELYTMTNEGEPLAPIHVSVGKRSTRENPRKYSKPDIFDVQTGDIVGAIDGPGQFPEERPFTVIDKVTDRWGRHLKVRNAEGRVEAVYSFTDVGIGFYYLGKPSLIGTMISGIKGQLFVREDEALDTVLRRVTGKPLVRFKLEPYKFGSSTLTLEDGSRYIVWWQKDLKQSPQYYKYFEEFFIKPQTELYPYGSSPSNIEHSPRKNPEYWMVRIIRKDTGEEIGTTSFIESEKRADEVVEEEKKLHSDFEGRFKSEKYRIIKQKQSGLLPAFTPIPTENPKEARIIAYGLPLTQEEFTREGYKYYPWIRYLVEGRSKYGERRNFSFYRTYEEAKQHAVQMLPESGEWMPRIWMLETPKMKEIRQAGERGEIEYDKYPISQAYELAATEAGFHIPQQKESPMHERWALVGTFNTTIEASEAELLLDRHFPVTGIMRDGTKVYIYREHAEEAKRLLRSPRENQRHGVI